MQVRVRGGGVAKAKAASEKKTSNERNQALWRDSLEVQPTDFRFAPEK